MEHGLNSIRIVLLYCGVIQKFYSKNIFFKISK